MTELQQKQLSPDTKSILNTIDKVNSNPKDTAHGKNELNIYRPLTDITVMELKSQGYDVNTIVVKEGQQRIGGIFHIIKWK